MAKPKKVLTHTHSKYLFRFFRIIIQNIIY
jgi:hypothetical protein